MLDRLNAPSAFAPGLIKLPPATKIILPDNGVNIFLFNKGSQEVCKIEFIFPGGKQKERLKGSSLFTSKMIFEGANGKSSEQISEYFDFYGAFIDSSSTLDDNQITLYCQSQHIAELIPTLVGIFKNPSFPGKELALLKERQSQQIKTNEGKSQYWSTKLLRESLFGKNNAYGHVLSVEDVNLIDDSSLRSFHEENIQFAPFDVFVSGSFDEDLLLHVLKDQLDGSKPKVIETSQKSEFGTPEIIKKELADSQQSSVKLGLPSLSRAHKDYPLISVLNKYLGGFFGSRLMKVIREEKGLTYGMHSGIMHLRQASFLQISGDVKLGSAEEVVDLVRKEISELQKSLIKEDDLDTVKSFMVGEFQNEINTTFDLATKYKTLHYSQLPDNWHTHYFKGVMDATPESLMSAANEHINADAFHVVMIE